MKQLLVAVLVGMMVSGCYVQQPLAPPPTDAAPPPPPATGYPQQPQPPPPPANGGYSYGPSDYQRGIADGRAAAERAPTVGYAALGFVLGLVVAPVCFVIIAAGGGGGGGSCGNGDCFTGNDSVPSGVEAPPAATGDYRAGWQKGWAETVKPRRESAETIGFVAGVVVAVGLIVLYLTIPANRDALQNNPNGATGAAGTPPGARPAGGFGIRF